MGWYYGYSSKASLIDDLTCGRSWTRESDGTSVRHSVLHKCCRGNVLWTVEETAAADQTHTFIGCYLLEAHKGDWGYKPMDESMHPFYYSCPKAYLRMVPEVCREWRDKVWQYHGYTVARST